jgi:hypothetical protein
LEEKSLEDFYTPKSNSVYCPVVKWHGDFKKDMGYYSTAEKAWEAICENWDFEEDRLSYMKIEKETIDIKEYTPSVILNTEGKVIHFYGKTDDDYPDDLNMIFIHLLVPFIKGDIVMDDGGKPCVLRSLMHWKTERPLYDDYLSGKVGDGSDMIPTYYFI